MVYLICNILLSIDLALYGVSRAEDMGVRECAASANNENSCQTVRYQRLRFRFGFE